VERSGAERSGASKGVLISVKRDLIRVFYYRPGGRRPALRPFALLPSVRLAFCSCSGQRPGCVLGHALRGAT